jgi:hemolysin D
LVICGGFCSALAWSFLGKLDIHAVAQGKIQPTGRSKVVQPLETGKVVAVLVENGSRVRAGDVLLELDPTESSADREAQARDLDATRAEVARRRLAVEVARSGILTPLPVLFSPRSQDAVRQREQDVLVAEIGQLASTRERLRAELEEKSAQIQRLHASLARRKELLAVLKERVDMRDAVDAQGHGYRAKVIDALQEYDRERTQFASEEAEVLEVEAAKVSLRRKIDESVAQFIADHTQKLAEAERKSDRLEQELIKAETKSERTRLRAPIDGVVQQLAITSTGQVVTGGQPLLTIVPLDGPIEIEAMILNKDIGFVHPGQAAVVKVEAFPFTRYGTIDATVTRVSRDGVDEKTAANLSDIWNLTKPQGGVATATTATANGLVFPATLTLSRTTISVDQKEIPLRPGMAVGVEIKTGQRRAIDFVLSPMREVQDTAAHER